MKSGLLVIVTVALFLFVPETWAHPPHESRLGTFQLPDGIKIEIMGYYVDGIIFADPVSVRFRLPNGESLAETPFSRDAAVFKRDGTVEVYQFASIWLPFATRIHLFDGTNLREINSKSRFVLSPVFHVIAHWGEYSLVLVALAIFHRASRASRKVSGSKLSKVVQKVGLIAVQALLGLLLLAKLLAGNVSPIIIALAYGFLFVLSRQIARRIFPRQFQQPPQI
ncbi:MAG: hypothetical protein ABIQ35_01355 [Verrucomicrobiota bacterium]